MKIAESFLSLVRRASKDLDVERIREGVLELSRRHPDLSTRRKAALMVESTARKAKAPKGMSDSITSSRWNC